MSQGQHFDVVIVGGGMVGCALAASLEFYFKDSLGIAIIEAAELPGEMPAVAANINEVDARVSAISHASYRLFQNLGVWDSLSGYANPFTTMDVWDADGTGNIQFSAVEMGQPQLGFLLENRRIAAALQMKIQQKQNIHRFAGVRLEAMTKAEQGWVLKGSAGQEFHARLLVGADGGRSWVREQGNITSRSYDFHQQAIVATVKTQTAHGNCARQRFLPSGPLAFLPLKTTFDSGHMASIVWSVDEDEVQSVLSLDDRMFARRLAEAFEFRLGEVLQVSQRFSFPLVQKHAKHYIQEQLALVGDAAHTVHPLAGQGVNLGFLDVATLAQELFYAHTRGAPPGERPALRRFERRRKSENQMMMTGFRGFKLLFGEKALPVRWARNTGMRMLNDAKPVKNHLVQQAMGMAGDLPDLAR